MNSSKGRRVGNNTNRWPAPSGRSRSSKFPPNSSETRDFTDWRRQQVAEQPKPQDISTSVIQSPLASLLGNVAQVFLVDEVVVEGVLKHVSNDLELSMKACTKEKLEDFLKKKQLKEPTPEFIRKEIIPQLSINFSDVVNIQIPLEGNAVSNDGSFQVDSSISDFSGDIKDRVLTPWQPSDDDGHIGSLHEGQQHQSPNGWTFEEMLNVNTKKFGVKSNFDSSMSSYMTPIDKQNPQYEEIQRSAAKLAHEIEGDTKFRERDNVDSGTGEEEAFSSVQRPLSTRDQMPSMQARGRGQRMMQNQRPPHGRELNGTSNNQPGRESPVGMKKNGNAVSGAPPPMQFSYSDKVKKSCVQEQTQLPSTDTVLATVNENPATASPKKQLPAQSPTVKECTSPNQLSSSEREKEFFSKPKTTYSKFGRACPTAKSSENLGSPSDLDDLLRFQSVQIQSTSPRRESLKKGESEIKDKQTKPIEIDTQLDSKDGSKSIDLIKDSTAEVGTKNNGSELASSTLPLVASAQHDGATSSTTDSGNSAKKPSMLNPNAKEFKFNPHASEFVPKPSQQIPVTQLMTAPAPPVSPLQQQHGDPTAYQFQPHLMQLSAQQQQQQQQHAQHMTLHAQSQPYYTPHHVAYQTDPQRQALQARKPRPMGQPQVVFSPNHDYNGVHTASPMPPPFYSPGQFVQQVPANISIQAQGVPQQTYPEGRQLIVLPQGPPHSPYAQMGSGQMIIPVAQQPMQGTMPPGGMPMPRNQPGNGPMPNSPIIRYNNMQFVGQMPGIPTSQGFVTGQPMQNYSPMN